VYTYDAIGNKLEKSSTIGGTTTYRYYAGIYEYGNTKALELIHTDEGMVNVSGTTYTYEYHLKDHLGNVRAVFNSNGTMSQKTDYYPFGMISSITQSGSTDNNYLYNGKELQDDNFGSVALDWYDYGARFYDPQIGRFTTVDPMAELYFSINPYCYALNNPVALIDPDGQKVVNGQEEEKKNAEEKKKKAEARYNAANKEINKKEWRAARRELNKATRALNSAEDKYQSVQSAINALQEIAPDIFNELDNLRGPNGQNIDISVTALETNETYTKDGEEYELKGGTYALPGLGSYDSYIKNPITGSLNTIGVKLKSGAGALILAHEGGHCVYYSRNVREYYFLLLRQNPSWAKQGGHANGDPNGIAGTQMEKRFMEAYRMYRKQLRQESRNNR
jgi:RHS repeat-associated protein